jgi:hypothetical protein
MKRLTVLSTILLTVSSLGCCMMPDDPCDPCDDRGVLFRPGWFTQRLLPAGNGCCNACDPCASPCQPCNGTYQPSPAVVPGPTVVPGTFVPGTQVVPGAQVVPGTTIVPGTPVIPGANVPQTIPVQPGPTS